MFISLTIGFGWYASLKTDEFFLLSDVYDISSLMQYPRSQKISLVLSRIEYQGSQVPLFMRDRPGTAIITIKEACDSNKVVKILAPWSLPIFRDFQSEDLDMDDTDVYSDDTSSVTSEDEVTVPLG